MGVCPQLGSWTSICSCWLDILFQPRSSVRATRISLGFMINEGMFSASNRRIPFGGPVIALGLTGKSLSSVKWELMKPSWRPSVSLVSETGILRWMPNLLCGPLLIKSAMFGLRSSLPSLVCEGDGLVCEVHLCTSSLQNLAVPQDFYSLFSISVERSWWPRIRRCGTDGFQDQGQCLFIGLAALSLLVSYCSSLSLHSFYGLVLWGWGLRTDRALIALS